MDSCSSAEDLIVKTRKPYTITKQRERWTEEEHNRFLEALKLYGRAWQRIEDHIGSKTAVQIRSHAQKFFSKLEKEALFKGVPVSQTLDIDIPPPRPKRKPSFPYPRKTSTTIPASQIGTNDGKPLSSECPSQCKEVLDLEKEPAPERSGDEEKTGYAKQDQHENCSKGLTGLEEAPCSSVCSERKGYIILPTVTFGNASTVTEFVLSAEKSNQDEQNSSYVNGELEGNENLEKGDSKLMMDQDYDRIKGSENSNNSPKLVRGEKKDDPTCGLLVEEMQATQNYPRHVPLHVLDGRLGTSNETLSSNMTCQGTIIHPTGEVCKHPNPFVNPAVSASTEYQSDTSRSSVHQTFSAFQPSFTQIQHNEYNYRSFLPISPFSNHIVSTLLQNPAASFPASFWPYTNLETLPDFQGGIPPGQMNSSPSMAAIAAATVSAATAWWAAHGLLPLCTPLHSSFACAPVSTSGVSSMDTAQALSAKKETGENFHNLSIQDHRDPEYSEALQVPKSASKLPTPSPSPSRSEECGVAEPESGLKTADLKKVMADIQQHDTNQAKRRRLVDRSSCGSNTVSSSEVETDALEKHDTAKEELKEQAADPPASESSIRHIKTINNINDSWKEVSEEGRLAFKALFTREVLPQSFSPSPDIINKEHHNSGVEEGKEEEKNGHASLLDLNRKTWNTCSNLQEPENNTSFRSDHVSDGGLLTIGLGLGKLKSCRAGFRPYKRCSVEAKENRVGSTSCQVEEKVPKRLRIKGEAST